MTSPTHPAGVAAWPQISLIVPSLNQAHFLEATLACLAQQGYPALEVVVVDGGSTDGSQDIIRRHDDIVTRWVSEPDGGQSDAINKGMRLATGSIVSWLNSDDLLFEGALLAIGRAFAENPQADVIYGSGAKIDEGGGWVKAVPATPAGPGFLRNCMKLLQNSVFFKRALFARVGGLDRQLHYAMDWDMFLKFEEAGAVFLALNQPIGKWRRYATAKTCAGGWSRAGELARIGRAHHGWRDRNHLIYRFKQGVSCLTKNRPLRQFVDATLVRAFGHQGFMIYEWPA
jgi:glycosyltransferase involved in cell wall biosynthesis